MKLVVYTGSFNPVTRGHVLVMEAAMNAVNADQGLFVVTADNYLKKKMILKNGSTFIIPEAVRKEMIESLSELNPKLGFGGHELGGTAPSTVKTLISLKKKYKVDEIYCLMGADKLRQLPKWSDVDTIIDSMKVIVAERAGFDINEVINKSEWLINHQDRLILVHPDEEAFEVSSSKVRERFLAGTDCSPLLTSEVSKILNTFNPSDFPPLSHDQVVECIYKYGGRFGKNEARKNVYNYNKKLFDNWDDSFLGNRNHKLKDTKVYKHEFQTNFNYGYNTITGCYNKDAGDVALELIRNDYNPAILNLASNVRPCGGYNDGLGAQEENLCYMSTLSQSLYQFGNIKYKCVRDAGVDNTPNVYPLNINYGGIYSPDVTFFRQSETNYYALRDKPFECSVITVASLSNRQKNNYTNDESKYFNLDGTLNEEGLVIEKNKIRTIFRIALDNGHDSLVLGAFGCGVYHLLPSEVSKLFYDILNEPEFKNNFKNISFAILSKDKENKFKPFYDLFE